MLVGMRHELDVVMVEIFRGSDSRLKASYMTQILRH